MRRHLSSQPNALYLCLAATSLAVFLAAAGILSTGALRTQRVAWAQSGAPVITSFNASEIGYQLWQLSGTVSASDYSSMIVTFEGMMNDTENVAPNGTFSITVNQDFVSGDWVDVFATDRWGQDSDYETWYF